MTGALSAFAVSRTLLIVFDPITLTAGSANPFSFASLKIF
jgi:hypothetical protein